MKTVQNRNGLRTLSHSRIPSVTPKGVGLTALAEGISRDGRSYKIDASSPKTEEQLYELVLESYNDEKPSMSLSFAVTDDGQKLRRVMIPKGDIDHIRLDRYKPYAQDNVRDMHEK